jgi:hypothetical protein
MSPALMVTTFVAPAVLATRMTVSSGTAFDTLTPLVTRVESMVVPAGSEVDALVQ